MLRFNNDNDEIIKKLFNNENSLLSSQSIFNINLKTTCIDDNDKLA